MMPPGGVKTRSTTRGPATLPIRAATLGPTPGRAVVSAKRGLSTSGRMGAVCRIWAGSQTVIPARHEV